MAIKLLAFDLDGTLAPSKSPVPDEIIGMIKSLLLKYEVCIISGGKFEQFDKQLLSRINNHPLSRLHLMPTCGTRYYTWQDGWNCIYSEDLTEEEVQRAINAINLAVEHLPLSTRNVWGQQIENRGSQITFSALGQEAPIEVKECWDLNGVMRESLRSFIQAAVPSLEVRAGGSTSIDITRKGIDKAYGMRRLLDLLSIPLDEVVFFGDRMYEGGNDYPVKAMGIESLSVNDWQDTLVKVKEFLNDKG